MNLKHDNHNVMQPEGRGWSRGGFDCWNSNREALAISVLDMRNPACIGQGAISSTQYNEICHRAEKTCVVYTHNSEFKSLLIREDARFFVHRHQFRPVSLSPSHTSSVETESRASALLQIARGRWQTPSWESFHRMAPSSVPAVKASGKCQSGRARTLRSIPVNTDTRAISRNRPSA